MLLAIDIGNTNTVFALCDNAGGSLVYSWRLRSVASRSSDEYASFLQPLLAMNGVSWSDIGDVVVASVVPDINFHMSRFCQSYLNQEPLYIDASNAGVEVGLPDPLRIGADRLANAAAVTACYMPQGSQTESHRAGQSGAIVIDFGTATNFDVIDKNGVYRGGAIAPGIKLSMSALHAAAAKLPRVSIARPDKAIGDSTESAMQSGIYWGYVGLIEKLTEQLSAELNGKPLILATGGLAPLFAQGTNVIDAVDEHLTLKGVLAIYQTIKGIKS